MNSTQLPQYQCHKKVRAAKITGISPRNIEAGTTTLYFEAEHASKDVTTEWIAKHNPMIGGYYVQYDDGYASYSPENAFETGYTKI